MPSKDEVSIPGSPYQDMPANDNVNSDHVSMPPRSEYSVPGSDGSNAPAAYQAIPSVADDQYSDLSHVR